jgi:hypothetical protein
MLKMSVLALATALVTAAPHAERTIYVSITDKSGVPPASVAPSSVTVREDGQAREVISIKPATTPPVVSLLIDTSQATQSMTTELRQGMTGFVTKLLEMAPDARISLMTFGDRPTPVRDFTSSAAVLTKDTGRLFPVTGSGAYLLDALRDAAKSMKAVDAPRKAIVAFVDEEGTEFSNASRQQVFDAIKDSGAAVWIITLQGRTTASPQTTEERDRAAVIGDLPRQSGGTTTTILTKISLPDKAAFVASQIAHQFAVTYGRPDSLIPPSKLEVTASDNSLVVTAPRWTGQ